VEHKAIRDDLTFMMQLGLVGPSSTQCEQLFQAWKGFMRSQVSRSPPPPPPLSSPPTSKPSIDNNEAVIRSLYFQMVDGWNKGNGETFASPFAENADLVGFDGTYLKGRREIASFLYSN
jgi:hypothetical protein